MKCLARQSEEAPESPQAQAHEQAAGTGGRAHKLEGGRETEVCVIKEKTDSINNNNIVLR